MEEIKTYAATRTEVLRDNIMNPSIEKNESEWWAHRHITELEARMQAMEALTSDAIGLVKVLANQVHSLPQAAVSSLTPRTFNEMFNNRDGAAYGQASRILERYELLFAPKSTNPTT